MIRRSALQYKVHYDTTLNGGFATTLSLSADPTIDVISVQEMHAKIKNLNFLVVVIQSRIGINYFIRDFSFFYVKKKTPT